MSSNNGNEFARRQLEEAGRELAKHLQDVLNNSPELRERLEAAVSGQAPKIGTRVGAVVDYDHPAKVARVLGYGTYVGEEIPVEAVGLTAEMARTLETALPAILLDSGDKVYGCECHWGPEDQVAAQLLEWMADGVTVQEIDIKQLRAEFNQRMAQETAAQAVAEADERAEEERHEAKKRAKLKEVMLEVMREVLRDMAANNEIAVLEVTVAPEN